MKAGGQIEAIFLNEHLQDHSFHCFSMKNPIPEVWYPILENPCMTV